MCEKTVGKEKYKGNPFCLTGQDVFGILDIIVHVLFGDDFLGIPAAGMSDA